MEERRGTGREEETGGTKISRGMKERREQEDGVISEERPKVTIIARNGASILNQFVNVLFHTVGVRRNPCNQCERQQGAARNFSDGESHQHNHTQPTDEEDCLYEKLDWVDLHPRSAGNLDAFETLDIWDITVCPGIAKGLGDDTETGHPQRIIRKSLQEAIGHLQVLRPRHLGIISSVGNFDTAVVHEPKWQSGCCQRQE